MRLTRASFRMPTPPVPPPTLDEGPTERDLRTEAETAADAWNALLDEGTEVLIPGDNIDPDDPRLARQDDDGTPLPPADFTLTPSAFTAYRAAIDTAKRYGAHMAALTAGEAR